VVESYHHFTATAIRYFGVSVGQRKKFARALPSAHVDSSHCFAPRAMMTRATSKQGQVYHLMRGKINLCLLMLALILLSHLSSQISR